MRRLTAVTWSLLAACGRIGFAPCVGCTASDAPGPVGIEQTATTLGTETITFMPTHGGDLLVVGIITLDGVLSAITDDAGNTYRSANVDATPAAGCGLGAALWYAANARPATTINITLIGGSNANVPGAWLVEVTGASAPVAGMQASAQQATGVITVPDITAPAGTAVFSTVTVCNNNLVGVHFGSPFMGLPAASGAGATAYVVVNASGSYGAAWDLLNANPASWGGATVAFQ